MTQSVLDATAGQAAKQISQVEGTRILGRSLVKLVGFGTCGGHRKEIRADIHAPSQQPLVVRQASLILHGTMEQRQGEVMAGAFDEAQVA
jgi:hypothetical protein